MRMMMQIAIPVEAGNQAARTGAFGPSFQKILKSLNPEAAYFTAVEDGERGGFIVFDLNAEDLAKAIPGIEKAVKKHSKAASCLTCFRNPNGAPFYLPVALAGVSLMA